MKKHWRQGDVLVIESAIPSAAIKQEVEERIILEHGEVTGHAHAIEKTDGVTMLLDGTRKFLEICFAKSATITHEEHKKIPLPAGSYEVRRQCTWSALEQLARTVAD